MTARQASHFKILKCRAFTNFPFCYMKEAVRSMRWGLVLSENKDAISQPLCQETIDLLCFLQHMTPMQHLQISFASVCAIPQSNKNPASESKNSSRKLLLINVRQLSEALIAYIGCWLSYFLIANRIVSASASASNWTLVHSLAPVYSPLGAVYPSTHFAVFRSGG